MESSGSCFQLNVMMVMKMAAVSTTTLLLLCYLITSTDSRANCDQYAVTGGDLTLILNHTLGNLEKLKWKHNDVTVFYRQPINKYLTGTKEDVSENGSLKLKSLSKNKAGRYTPEVHDQNGQAIQNLKSIQLCILDPVQKPKVEFKCSPPTVTLTCKVNQTKDTKFKWFQNNKELEKMEGPVLNGTAEALEEDSFRCEVYNFVSNETSDPVDKPCYKPNPVPKPNVTFNCSLPNVMLACNVGQAKDTKFKWFQNDKVLEKEKDPVLKLNAETVENDSFRCEVSNRVSNKTSDPVDKPCYRPKSFLYEELCGIEIWVFIAIGGAIVLLLIIIVIVCCQTRRKKRSQLSGVAHCK
ncbi:uncharacterized protein LOC119903440 isoform X2 [Micropterus salmoides]|uniref:uncharacterized protein LOC119903440 isoform X2 n=1 Tax=Micropterus salmoides TaxID=27706 RepID=UPI0018EC1572|nr:uncharacterized protein LOC119903440 isoform X2 [Micropterus salmoides]